jgi:hypothetical protein
MALNVGLDVSFGNMQGWKGIQEKAGKVKSTKIYVTNGDISVEISAGSKLVFYET